jgi:hypothetical protein
MERNTDKMYVVLAQLGGRSFGQYLSDAAAPSSKTRIRLHNKAHSQVT